MIYVVATTHVKPDQREAYIKGAEECIAETRKEKGCISYEYHTSIHDPNLFVVVERWENRSLDGRLVHDLKFGGDGTWWRHTQVGSGGSKSFANGRSSMRPALDDTRVSNAIRLTQKFDYKQHGESAQSETVEKHQRLTMQNILFVKIGTATSKVPRACR